MSNYTYKVVPFIGTIKGKQSAADVSQQLQVAIENESTNGWELHQVGKTDIAVKPGCIAGLFGAKTAYMSFDQIIFKKAI